MVRSLLLVVALFGVGLLFYDATYYPWSRHSMFSTDNLFGNSLGNGGVVLLVLLFFRLGVVSLLVKEAYQAVRWQHYRGAEERSQWMHDFSPDAN